MGLGNHLGWGSGVLVRCYCFVNPLRKHLAHSNSSHDCHNTKVVTEGTILDLNICHGKLDSFATLITVAELSGQGLPYSCLLAAHIWQGLRHPVAELNVGPLLLNLSIHLCFNTWQLQSWEDVLTPKFSPGEKALKAWAQWPLRLYLAIACVMRQMHGPITRVCQLKRPKRWAIQPSSGSGQMFFWKYTPTWNVVWIWEQWLLWSYIKVNPLSAYSKLSSFNTLALHPRTEYPKLK